MNAAIVAGALAALLGLGGWEAARLRRHLRAISTRVHVNGTRGKSSVARLIAGGLREGGVRTCAKTSGTAAAWIPPDGRDALLRRPGPPNVIEQARTVSRAAAVEARALVIECMALRPHYQALTELRMLRSTHGVITNARADHLDVMGPTARDVARALAGTVPVGGTLFTAERRHLDVLARAARDRGTAIVAIDADEVEGVTEEELAGFSHTEHRENVALALRVCAELGVDRRTALRGMHAATPDVGAATEHALRHSGRELVFVNAFSANDPESTEMLWRRSLERHPSVDRRVVLVNCRADRVDRSREIGRACARWTPADRYLLLGTGTRPFADAASRAGLDPGRLVLAEGLSSAQVFERVLAHAGERTLVVGIGNVHGPGIAIARSFRDRAGSSRPAAALHAGGGAPSGGGDDRP